MIKSEGSHKCHGYVCSILFNAHLLRSAKIKLPAYVDYVKTGRHKELAPYDKDWYYIRTGE